MRKGGLDGWGVEGKLPARWPAGVVVVAGGGFPRGGGNEGLGRNFLVEEKEDGGEYEGEDRKPNHEPRTLPTTGGPCDLLPLSSLPSQALMQEEEVETHKFFIQIFISLL
ncbi:hypothetical protein KFK09_026069 [Dendrobium nobile]|uniref:Uncharacterized protein n=1 Tax=Dendrobium nobile TaxID=94219 RepID=A0A8T3A6Q5_DENNO|nr:hypothetical protein KFK09_026069 [Dendrobium nobile]